MTRRAIRSLFLCLLTGAFLFLAAPLSAQMEFRTRLLTAGGPVREKVISLNIKIEDFTTEEEVRQLQLILAQKGTTEFLTAFRNSDKGVINFKSARGLNLRINAAQTFPTDKGRKIQVFTERQSWDVDTHIRVSGKYLFMVIELEIDQAGKIKGKFYDAANIELSRTGNIILESYQPPMMLMGVRRAK